MATSIKMTNYSLYHGPMKALIHLSMPSYDTRQLMFSSDDLHSADATRKMTVSLRRLPYIAALGRKRNSAASYTVDRWDKYGRYIRSVSRCTVESIL